jgi:signal transduction histidine kinase
VSSSETAWQRPRPDGARLRHDMVLGIGMAVASVASVAFMAAATPGLDLGWRGVEAYVWAVAASAPLCVRRSMPVAAMVACSAVFFTMGIRLPLAIASYGIQVALFISIFSAWAWSRHRRRLHAWTGLTFTAMFVWVGWLILDVYADPQFSEGPGIVSPAVAIGVLTLVVNLLYFFGALAWGLAAWRGARQREQLAAANAALRRQGEQLAEQAVRDERLRIARDLHDVVAHHVSGIGVQAAGARRVVEKSPQAAQQALRTIEVTSRRAVQEMQQLVGLLRTEPEDDEGAGPQAVREPQPGLDQLPDLLDEAGRQGLEVTLRRHGPDTDVPATVGLTLYRTVQEALTNVRKHSRSLAADVTVRGLETDGRPAVEVEVVDDGPARERPREPGGRGWGIAGIRERVAWLEGETDIGPRPGGGFRVRVRIPLQEEAA